MKKTLLVFGGSGFLGQAICQRALQHSWRVISVSTHGKPINTSEWMNHQDMYWLAEDVLSSNNWVLLFEKADYAINLIGIIKENKRKNQTFQRLIIQTNERISSAATLYHVPYIFISARVGPKKYVRAKQQAERFLRTLPSESVIIRSGLVVTKHSPTKNIQGQIIRVATKVPVIKQTANKAYPTPLTKLVDTVIAEISQPITASKVIDLTR